VALEGDARFRVLHALGGAQPEPWVIDANEMRQAILHTARTGKASLLARAASEGLITWYIAEHAVGEVHEHLDGWADREGVERSAAWEAWNGVYKPMLRMVPGDLNHLKFTVDEQLRLDGLARRDPDDLPTARLAMAIGARLVTRDNAVIAAGYGPGRSSEDHGDLLIPTSSALAASGHLRDMEVVGAALAGGVIVEVVSLVRRFPLLGVAGAAGAALALRTAGHRERAVSTAQPVWTAVGKVLEVLVVMHAEISGQLARYEPVLGSLDDTVRQLGSAARSRIVMWMLARSPVPDASATGLAGTWPGAAAPFRSETAIRSVLYSHPALTQTRRGRFQLGIPLTSTTSEHASTLCPESTQLVPELRRTPPVPVLEGER
jgi:predicted nucleic acid-binding protein